MPCMTALKQSFSIRTSQLSLGICWAQGNRCAEREPNLAGSLVKWGFSGRVARAMGLHIRRAGQALTRPNHPKAPRPEKAFSEIPKPSRGGAMTSALADLAARIREAAG